MTYAEAFALISLATVSYHLRRDDDVARFAVGAIKADPDVTDMETVALLLLAGVAVRRGNLPRAGKLLGASTTLRENTGYEFEPAERDVEAKVLVELGDGLESPDARAAYEEGRALSPEAARELGFEA